MSLTFPLSLDDFFDHLPIYAAPIELNHPVTQDQTRGGQILRAEHGVPLWAGQVDLGDMLPAEARFVQARINLVKPAGRSFLAYDSRYPFPLSDPTGAIIAGADVQIKSLPADPRLLSLKGLPAGYELNVGDRLSFTYGANPIRYAYHEVATPATAYAAGGTDNFMVSPPIRPGAVIGRPVTLIKPALKCTLNEWTPPAGRRAIETGARFSFSQTLR